MFVQYRNVLTVYESDSLFKASSTWIYCHSSEEVSPYPNVRLLESGAGIIWKNPQRNRSTNFSNITNMKQETTSGGRSTATCERTDGPTRQV